MKTNQFKIGFVLSRVSCSMCQCGGTIQSKIGISTFFELKEELFSEIQKLHNAVKPTACNGKLTIVYSHAVQETT